jgi:phosphopantetheine adenylyltransferase
VVNPVGTFEKALQLCQDIAEELQLNVLNMKLQEVMDFSNEIQIIKSKKVFNEKREQFFTTFDLPIGIIAKPLYCSEVFDVLRGK